MVFFFLEYLLFEDKILSAVNISLEFQWITSLHRIIVIQPQLCCTLLKMLKSNSRHILILTAGASLPTVARICSILPLDHLRELKLAISSSTSSQTFPEYCSSYIVFVSFSVLCLKGPRKPAKPYGLYNRLFTAAVKDGTKVLLCYAKSLCSTLWVF